ncbi:MAG: cell division protein FtsX [Thermobacillus sp. ZCTH02-B1]|uniref:ABC transporter permease n=1 Tax=Thermobacillus sp. ZCTH02-B1 TaxID=1858795 RepID=UPI000B56E5F3|nr:ABC transporter permease [Thermobacillus sp. ZCTH02-B1]OUM97364.1 MAG: cell division protein FtsX [Thermobacillus sp. ZCTH02-B1]
MRRKGFFTKLALTNIRKNAQTYFPYIFASSAAVMMFYNMLYLSLSREVRAMSDSHAVRTVLGLGVWVIGIFSVILLLYINSFLIKRRKKEFGLFNILGMEKKHIARIMLIETAVTGFVCIGIGLIAGILFGKLGLLLLLRLLHMDAVFGFEIPLRAVALTVAVFGAIFLINLIYNVFQVHLSRPIELLKGSQVGEKEPPTKWLMALTGAAALGGGYYISLTVESPIAALYLFFIAVLLVIAGTYNLFTAGSIAILKLLRRNRRFYYRTGPFIAVSGMIYRMKQNAAGLASICILSTMVIVMVSSTVSLYAGLENSLRNRYIREIQVNSVGTVPAEIMERMEQAVADTVEQAGITVHNPYSLRSVTEITLQDGNAFTRLRGMTLGQADDIALLLLVTTDEYRRHEGVDADLSAGEALVHVIKGNIPGDMLDFGGYSLNIRGRVDLPNMMDGFEGQQANLPGRGYVIIMANEQELLKIRRALNPDREPQPGFEFSYYFDTKAEREAQFELVSALNSRFGELGLPAEASAREKMRDDFLSMYGVLFFLGMFLGALFILGTVLIIYYKQITEGYDDRERFAIMTKVGLSRDEIRRTIRFQVLSVFYLPLVVAVCHIAAAFPVIRKLIGGLFGMTDTWLYAACTALTILVFAVCYAMIYALTARTYYRIVR